MREGQPAEQSAQFCIGNSPRTRGGQPCAAPSLACHSRFTPHARGATQCFNDAWFIAIILPACAGVNPSASNQGHCGRNFPRMRGGQPWAQSIQSRVLFSPHTRGSTPHPQSFRRGYRIHPACAGVTLSREWLYEPVYSPRMRGGQPSHRSLIM